MGGNNNNNHDKGNDPPKKGDKNDSKGVRQQDSAPKRKRDVSLSGGCAAGARRPRCESPNPESRAPQCADPAACAVRRCEFRINMMSALDSLDLRALGLQTWLGGREGRLRETREEIAAGPATCEDGDVSRETMDHSDWSCPWDESSSSDECSCGSRQDSGYGSDSMVPPALTIGTTAEPSTTVVTESSRRTYSTESRRRRNRPLRHGEPMGPPAPRASRTSSASDYLLRPDIEGMAWSGNHQFRLQDLLDGTLVAQRVSEAHDANNMFVINTRVSDWAANISDEADGVAGEDAEDEAEAEDEDDERRISQNELPTLR
ncbi:hypothetical protein LTS18_005430 [Coniosporium uncinatum]|uniref:Uncharacterized protein n=1 Tax=Coniosporium uncinatum TaxID=93489 RepID=A0ACC3DXH6_9PEZI|nr:hypothetical protein LTS18_005430 [Coniosporium uncinatum]